MARGASQGVCVPPVGAEPVPRLGFPVSHALLHAEGLHRDHPVELSRRRLLSCPRDCSTLTTGEYKIPLQLHRKSCYQKGSLVVSQAEALYEIHPDKQMTYLELRFCQL